MIGVLIIAHDSIGESLVRAVTHVLGARPPQFEVLSVAATDDPALLLVRLQGRIEGWRLALFILVAFALFSVAH